VVLLARPAGLLVLGVGFLQALDWLRDYLLEQTKESLMSAAESAVSTERAI